MTLSLSSPQCHICLHHSASLVSDDAASEGDGEEETEEEENKKKHPLLSPKTAQVAAEIDEVKLFMTCATTPSTELHKKDKSLGALESQSIRLSSHAFFNILVIGSC